jgi:hypothetical protein
LRRETVFLATLTITNTSELPDSNAQILTGSIDAADAAQTMIGTTTSNGADAWGATVALPTTSPYVLTAQASDLAGNLGVSNAVDLASEFVARAPNIRLANGHNFAGGSPYDALELNWRPRRLFCAASECSRRDKCWLSLEADGSSLRRRARRRDGRQSADRCAAPVG